MKVKRLLSLILMCILLISTFSMPVNAATKSKAIVILPGIAGSKLLNSSKETVWFYASTNRMNQLACTETGTSINTITPNTDDTGGVLNTCQDLYSKLSSAYGSTYDVFLFSYDWRMSCSKAATELANRLQSYTEVILVAHSMGGLVASKYLSASAANRAKVKKLITLGTPYTGSVRALYMMETGEFIDIFGLSPYKNTIKALICNFPAVYELLPNSRYSGSYIKDSSTSYSSYTNHWNFMKQRSWGIRSNGSVKPMFGTAVAFHNGLLINGTHIANSGLVDTYKIYGTGYDTISKVIYAADGSVSGVETVNSGDGTVITSSATNLQATSANKVYGFTCKHMNMPDTNSIINKIKTIIEGTVSSTASTSDEVENLSVNEKGWIIGMDNKRINVFTYNSEKVSISTEEGFSIFAGDDGCLYYINDKSEIIHAGYMWELGNQSFQYSLFDGDYLVQTDSTSQSDIKVEYMDNGYYLQSSVYENVADYELAIKNSESKAVTCITAEAGVITPSIELSNKELFALNGTA